MAADASGEADVAASFGVSCLPQPARAQVPKAASTAQLSVFLKIDIITSIPQTIPSVGGIANQRMKIQTMGYLLKLKNKHLQQIL